MNIALTYDLKADYLASGFTAEDAAEFDAEDTIAALAAAIAAAGHTPVRVGRMAALLPRLAGGETWPLAFNIAEGWRGSAREAQIPSLLEAYGVPVLFSSALAMAVCLDKALTKDVLASRGVAVSPHVVVEDAADLAARTLPFAYPVFAKPIGEGTGKGVETAGLVRSPAELPAVASRLLERFRQPVIIEPFLPGREFTVGIVGTGAAARVIGVMEVSLLSSPAAAAAADTAPAVYSYETKADYIGRVAYRLAADPEATAAGATALAAYRALSLRDAARVDLRSDAAGQPMFMEVNPLPGLHPVDSDLPILARLAGISFTALIGMILSSAIARM